MPARYQRDVRRTRSAATFARLFAIVLWVACSEDVQLVHAPNDAGKHSASTPSASSASTPTRTQFCEGAGFTLAPDAGVADACASLPGQLFRFALCSCGDAAFTASLASDAFDSTIAAYAPGQSGASLGIDGNFTSTAAVSLAGSLITTGTAQLAILASPFHVGGNFEARSDVIVTSDDVALGRDLLLDGNLLAVGQSVTIARDFVQTPGHTSAADLKLGGQMAVSDFSVSPPCSCADGELFDVAAAVAFARSHNDDAAASLARDALCTASDETLVLDCGRYLFDGGTLSSARALRAHARTAVFVDGDLRVSGSFAPDLGDTGELDLFVGGNFWLDPGASFGSQARPGALRVYVAGSGQIVLTGMASLSANLYAPHAALFATDTQAAYGSVFVAGYYATGDTALHYDRSVIRPPSAAPDACSGALAASCGTDADCEPPFYCVDGACQSALE